VKDELHWALTKRSGRIIPVMLETCDPASFHLRLPQIQSVDFTGNNGDSTGLLEQTLESVRAAILEQSLTLDHQSLSAELELLSLSEPLTEDHFTDRRQLLLQC